METGDLNNPGAENYTWGRVPLVVFKRNEKEHPLIKGLKSLQDAINRIESNFVNVMDEDIRNTILVLVNYDGENLGEFRYNLSKYGAVKVSTIDGQAGDVKTLRIEVNPENYKAVLAILKEALVENAKAFNVKDNRLNSDANQMHIQTAYHDMDLDADDMEVEWQAALEEMIYYINVDMQLKNTGKIDSEVTFTFNRNMMIDETSLIQNCVVSRDIISDETIREKHPWCIDPQKEAERLAAQLKEETVINPIEELRKAGVQNDG
jgi:SPP1 family phage portal protein